MLIKLGCGGVDLSGLNPAMWFVHKCVTNAWGDEEPVITSTWEGTHGPGSFHYQLKAEDFRKPKFDLEGKVQAVKKELGPGYDVIIEGDHVHIEYDPKGG